MNNNKFITLMKNKHALKFIVNEYKRLYNKKDKGPFNLHRHIQFNKHIDQIIDVSEIYKMYYVNMKKIYRRRL